MRTSSLSLAALSAVALAAAAATAHAQPGATPAGAPPPAPPPPATYAPYAPPPPQIEINEKSPGTALILSLGGTVAAFAIGGVANENALLGTASGLGVWLAPSFGHWYAGDGWTTGLTYRMAGGAAMAAGAIWVLSECSLGHDNNGGDDCGEPGFALIIGGAAAFVGGMVYDIATAPGAARRHNERQRQRVMQYQYAVTPTIGGDRVGLAIGGRF